MQSLPIVDNLPSCLRSVWLDVLLEWILIFERVPVTVAIFLDWMELVHSDYPIQKEHILKASVSESMCMLHSILHLNRGWA